MDQRIEAVLNDVPRPNDRAALKVFLTIAAKTRSPEKREALLRRWENNLQRHLREPMAKLHRVFNIVLAEEEAKSAEFENHVAAIRKRQQAERPKSVDAAP